MTMADIKNYLEDKDKKSFLNISLALQEVYLLKFLWKPQILNKLTRPAFFKLCPRNTCAPRAHVNCSAKQ